MDREVISTGKTIEMAIEQGLNMLGADRDSVEIEILESPSKGLLGLFGQKDAKVLIKMPNNPEQILKSFLEDILLKMGIDGKAEITVNGNTIKANLVGKDMGIIIGRRGDTLDALQHIAQMFANKEINDYYKVFIDTENYRAKREETLIILAKGIAKKVLKTHNEVVLEPMKAYERRIIHTALQEYNKVSTQSIGDEPYRKLVVSYKADGKYKNFSDKRVNRNR